MAEQWLDREDKAVAAGEQPDDDGDPSVPLTEWSPERESLARIEDLLQQVLASSVALGGAKPSPFKPTVRPETALKRARDARRIRANHDFMGRLLAPEVAAEDN